MAEGRTGCSRTSRKALALRQAHAVEAGLHAGGGLRHDDVLGLHARADDDDAGRAHAALFQLVEGGLRLTVGGPVAVDLRLAWFVREPFPSVATGTSVNFGYVDAERALELESEMDEGGVIFADGIESDRLEFLAGQRCEIGLAPERLRLVV